MSRVRKSATRRNARATASAVTIRDVAKQAAVSVATVSRFLNNPQRVQEKTRLRVEKVVRRLDFTPNLIASSLAKRQSRCIGLIIPSICSFFSPLIQEIERAVSADGGYLIVVSATSHDDDVGRTVQFLRQRRCDAIILHPYATTDRQIIEIMDAEPNIVLIHRHVEKHAARCVQVDNRAGARLATRHLIDCGHRNIAVITGPADDAESSERLEEFTHTLRDAGLDVDPDLVVEGDFSFASGERGTAQLLANGKRFSALFCFNDQMATGAIFYFRSVGVSLPEEISVVGFDDSVLSNQVYPRLTTVNQPLIEIGRIAAQRALALSGHREIPSLPSIVRPRLVVRDSVRRWSASEKQPTPSLVLARLLET